MVLSRRARKGQSTVETMLYISVICIAMAAVGYLLVGPLEQGTDGLRQDTRDLLTGSVGTGSNNKR